VLLTEPGDDPQATVHRQFDWKYVVIDGTKSCRRLGHTCAGVRRSNLPGRRGLTACSSTSPTGVSTEPGLVRFSAMNTDPANVLGNRDAGWAVVKPSCRLERSLAGRIRRIGQRGAGHRCRQPRPHRGRVLAQHQPLAPPPVDRRAR
jgi:hypothetical protein